MPWYLMVIPVLFDLLATPLSMAGLSMVAGSVYSMMRGMVVVFTALASLLLLGRKYHRHHYTGIVMIVIGIALVGFGALKKQKEGAKQDTSLFGIILIVFGQLFTAGIMISEEKLFQKYTTHPL